MLRTAILHAALLVLLSPAYVLANDVCVYQAAGGEVRQVRSIHQVPNRYRSQARCGTLAESSPKGAALARPEEIKLEGNLRREDLSTSVGRIHLRWPRSVEALFGRTPLRAMAEAAQTVSRALRTAAFPSELQSLNLNWQVVFMDSELPETQIPAQLINNCHPGWMTPPANIYIVGQRVAAGCSGGMPVSASVADAQLTEVLIHEMGHAVELFMVGNAGAFDRMRSEGFATWFEIYAAGHSSMLSQAQLRKKTHALAKLSLRRQPDSWTFAGTADDYARASMYFIAVEEKRGVRGLMDVYARIKNRGVNFIRAVKEEMLWDDTQLAREIDRVANKY